MPHSLPTRAPGCVPGLANRVHLGARGEPSHPTRKRSLMLGWSEMDVRHEALLMLDKRGAILDTAREVSRVLKQHKVRGAIIGGVAVVLHGHIRTTKDVDVYVA